MLSNPTIKKVLSDKSLEKEVEPLKADKDQFFYNQTNDLLDLKKPFISVVKKNMTELNAPGPEKLDELFLQSLKSKVNKAKTIYILDEIHEKILSSQVNEKFTGLDISFENPKNVAIDIRYNANEVVSNCVCADNNLNGDITFFSCPLVKSKTEFYTPINNHSDFCLNTNCHCPYASYSETNTNSNSAIKKLFGSYSAYDIRTNTKNLLQKKLSYINNIFPKVCIQDESGGSFETEQLNIFTSKNSNVLVNTCTKQELDQSSSVNCGENDISIENKMVHASARENNTTDELRASHENSLRQSSDSNSLHLKFICDKRESKCKLALCEKLKNVSRLSNSNLNRDENRIINFGVVNFSDSPLRNKRPNCNSNNCDENVHNLKDVCFQGCPYRIGRSNSNCDDNCVNSLQDVRSRNSLPKSQLSNMNNYSDKNHSLKNAEKYKTKNVEFKNDDSTINQYAILPTVQKYDAGSQTIISKINKKSVKTCTDNGDVRRCIQISKKIQCNLQEYKNDESKSNFDLHKKEFFQELRNKFEMENEKTNFNTAKQQSTTVNANNVEKIVDEKTKNEKDENDSVMKMINERNTSFFYPCYQAPNMIPKYAYGDMRLFNVNKLSNCNRQVRSSFPLDKFCLKNRFSENNFLYRKRFILPNTLTMNPLYNISVKPQPEINKVTYYNMPHRTPILSNLLTLPRKRSLGRTVCSRSTSVYPKCNVYIWIYTLQVIHLHKSIGVCGTAFWSKVAK
ncbi:hypothetical protein HELRODRAFT_169156 [Helobdella robusta]|uniref:Uncharacterized protein n=1 Tax=Helobdella robusta TaxID=6412 RepID=T1F1H8_HELRO|nr:hypothetical protein HELRODRAFT_169156 [Helobdella robusta]ESO08345.1 hypothetical protein HELRODRAFT_169156 [Helobdella robusta]